MNKYSKLMRNILTFAVGNLGSKMIAFVMLPFYTHLLSREEYGQIDLITTTLALVLPFITLNLIESVFRFSVDDTSNRMSTFTSVVFTCFLFYFVSLFTYFILDIEIFSNKFDFLFLTLLFLFIIQSISKQFVRALQKIKVFMASDLINTLVFVILNLLLIGKFDLGIEGYLISMIVAYSVDCFVLLIGGKLWIYLGIFQMNYSHLKEMIRYAFPLIPNALMWWIINISDRYIINYFLGIEANGIYSVAAKFPSMIYILYMVFNKGWQISAIEEGNNKDLDSFYSQVFKIISTSLIIATSIFILLNKSIMSLMVSSEFYIAWKYTPFLVIGVVFSAFASYAGTSYTTSKKTMGAFTSSLLAAISKVILSILLIPILGLQGVCISTAISFFIMFYIRLKDTKKYIELKFNQFTFFFSFILLLIQTLLHLNEIRFNLIYQLFVLSILILINFKTIKEMYDSIRGLIFKKAKIEVV